MNNISYLEIRKDRENKIGEVSSDHFQLNQFHDEIMKRVVHLSINQISAKLGPLPCSFSFFVMGSAGRHEQAIWSDQDHGIIYQTQSEKAKVYFLELGAEISDGLQQAGYVYCDGGVMAKNPLWCKSLTEWHQQLENWMQISSWETIRHLLIFIDGRSLYGDQRLIQTLKTFTYQTIDQNNLLHKILHNTMYLKKGIGVFRQFLTETHGLYTGSINIKETALLPYVNSVRILAIKGHSTETSTIKRLEQVPDKWFTASQRLLVKHHFLTLLNYRLASGDHTSYEGGHYLPIHQLEKEQRKEVRNILLHAASFYSCIQKLVERENANGHE